MSVYFYNIYTSCKKNFPKQVFSSKIDSLKEYCIIQCVKIHKYYILLFGEMATPVASFLEKVSFDNLLQCSSVEDIKALKAEKKSLCNGRCKCKHTSQFLCKPCANINRKMCRVYHDNNPFEELVLRVAYEYMFDIVTDNELRTGEWYTGYFRDEGHQERIRRLKRKVGTKVSQCKWLG